MIQDIATNNFMHRYQNQQPLSSHYNLYTDNVSLNSGRANSFSAIQKLKKSEHNLDMLKKRLLVLRTKEEGDKRKEELNYKKIKFHEQIQHQEIEHRILQHELKQKQMESKNTQMMENSMKRLSRKQRQQQVKDSLSQTRKSEYLAGRAKSEFLDYEQIKLSQQEIQRKQDNKNKVKKMHELSRRTLELYRLEKTHYLHEKKEVEAMTYLHQQQNKEDQIKGLMELEMEMLQRQSKSQQLAKDSKQKLSRILNPEKRLSRNLDRMAHPHAPNVSS